MTIIFFDLETTDKEPCGQILNYSFIRTNNNFEVEDELSGDIALSILQIPNPEALLANRVKILDHQARQFPIEPLAMFSIAKFINDSLQNSKDQVFLSGYNSTRFDLPYLRTSLIRNGINPYFSGKLKYCDILHLVRKAYLCNQDFPNTTSPGDPNKLSLSLEVVSKELGLLSGAQAHRASEDVLLTVELCKVLDKKFHLHPAKFNAYEPIGKETKIVASFPNYDQETNKVRSVTRNMALLSESYRGALWVDIERYKAGEGKAAISWYNKNGGLLIKDLASSPNEETDTYLEKARAEFPNLTPDNFFPKSSCDIEQDIYRLDMQKISTLSQIIWENERTLIGKIEDIDLQNLVSRYWMAYGLSAERRGEKWKAKVSEYAKYRYGSGSFQLVKNISENIAPEKLCLCYHPSLQEINKNIAALLDVRTDPEDLDILQQLQSYIETSELYQSA